MIFAEILGQPKAVNLLSRALDGNRLAHGYLFTGPAGVGKKETALALTAGLLCSATVDERPCGLCGGCIKFASGNHPDFITIQPDGAAIKIDQVRGLKKSLSFPPFEGGRRIVLIEDVQTMRREAANSLLKILEEPPPDNLLLLIASDSEPLLPTIVSRCQVIPFVPLSLELATQVVRRDNPEMGDDEARALAELSGGCPGKVEILYSEEVMALRNACVHALLSGSQDEALAVEQALDLAGQLAELKDGLEAVFDLLLIFFKEIMVGVLCNKDTGSDSECSAARERWNLQQLSDKIQAVESARYSLGRNCNRGLVCDVLLLDLFSR
jgi:DNA polymerase-3 subunit delta'